MVATLVIVTLLLHCCLGKPTAGQFYKFNKRLIFSSRRVRLNRNSLLRYSLFILTHRENSYNLLFSSRLSFYLRSSVRDRRDHLPEPLHAESQKQMSWNFSDCRSRRRVLNETVDCLNYFFFKDR